MEQLPGDSCTSELVEVGPYFYYISDCSDGSYGSAGDEDGWLP